MKKEKVTKANKKVGEMNASVTPNLHLVAEKGNGFGDEIIDSLEILRMKEGDGLGVLVAVKAIGKAIAAMKYIYEQKGFPVDELLTNEKESFLLGFKLNPKLLQYM